MSCFPDRSVEKSNREDRENRRSTVRHVGTVFADVGRTPHFAIDLNVVVGPVSESMGDEIGH